MRCFKFIMLIIILNLTTVYANPYNNKEVVNTKEVVSATWYVWERLNTDYDIELPNWKSAENWYQSAKKSGYNVGTTPKDDSIVIWKQDAKTYVGLVWLVNNENIVVKTASQTEKQKICRPKTDTNCSLHNNCDYSDEERQENTVCTENYIASNDTGIVSNLSLNLKTTNIVGYIYLDNKINSTNNNGSNNSKKNNNSNNGTTSNKKSVSKLKNLTVENYNINFQEDKDNYILNVDNNTEKINIQAEGEEGTIISGLGDKNLEVGSNKYEILVATKDKEDKVYNLEIIRADNDEGAHLNNSNDNDNSNNKENKMNYKMIILGSAVVVFIGLLLFI